MKVIFIEDVPEVALAGETKVVADGYGRNYLLPKRLAVLADSAASNVLQAQMKSVLAKRAQQAAEMSELAAKLKGAEITIKAKVGESERLYGSVTGADIVGEISQSLGLEVDKRKVDIEEPIRHLGSHEVTIRFSHDITADIKVTVVADAVAAEPEAEAAAEPEPEKKKKTKKAAAEAVEEEPAADEVAQPEAGVAEAEPEKKQKKAKKAAAEPKAEAEEPPAEAEEPPAEAAEPEAAPAEPEE